MSNLDRNGNERGAAYCKEEFSVCGTCGGTGRTFGDVPCGRCGGYGDIPSSVATEPELSVTRVADSISVERDIAREFENSGTMPPDLVASMTIWGEARGEGNIGMTAVASVIFFRSLRKTLVSGVPMAISVPEVCLAPHQFSCWSNRKFLQQAPVPSPEWDTCDKLASELVEGRFHPTVVATHYFADYIAPPSWAAKMKFVENIGRHLFYREW